MARGKKTSPPSARPGKLVGGSRRGRSVAAPAPATVATDEGAGESEHEPEVLVGELVSTGEPIALRPGPEFDDTDLIGESPPPDDPLASLADPDDLVSGPDRPAPLAPLRDPIARFMAEARRYPRLSEADERALIGAARVEGGSDAARTLVVHNLRLVVSIAFQYRRTWTSMLDLFQEGSVGLVEAVSRWDPDLGTRFGSYAAYWIRAYILRFLMRNARLIHVGNTRAGRKLYFRLEKERARLRAAGFEPTPKLLAANLDVEEKDIEEVARALDSREVSLAPGPDGEGLSLGDRLAAPGQASPEDQAARHQVSDSVRAAMNEFGATLGDPREAAVWNDHLAAAGEPQSLADLGRTYGVTKQRMGQIADQLKKRFRELLLARMGDEIKLAWQPEDQEIPEGHE